MQITTKGGIKNDDARLVLNMFKNDKKCQQLLDKVTFKANHSTYTIQISEAEPALLSEADIFA